MTRFRIFSGGAYTLADDINRWIEALPPGSQIWSTQFAACPTELGSMLYALVNYDEGPDTKIQPLARRVKKAGTDELEGHVVHHLQEGRTPCGLIAIPGPTRTVPLEHGWTDKRNFVTCPECLAVKPKR